MTVKCRDCRNLSISRMGAMEKYYCSPKQVWIPARKLGTPRNCGQFLSLIKGAVQ